MIIGVFILGFIFLIPLAISITTLVLGLNEKKRVILCPKCNKDITLLSFCPTCGFPNEESSKATILLIVSLISFVITIILGIILFAFIIGYLVYAA